MKREPTDADMPHSASSRNSPSGASSPDQFVDSNPQNELSAQRSEASVNAKIQQYSDEEMAPIDRNMSSISAQFEADQEAAQTIRTSAAPQRYGRQYPALSDYHQGLEEPYQQLEGNAQYLSPHDGLQLAGCNPIPRMATNQYVQAHSYGLDNMGQQQIYAPWHERVDPSKGYQSMFHFNGASHPSWPLQALPVLRRETPASHIQVEQQHKIEPSSTIIDLAGNYEDSDDPDDDVPLVERATLSPKPYHSNPSSISVPTAPKLPGPYSVNEAPSENGTLKFNFKLPEYEATFFIDKSGLPTAKISVPGLVREEVQLNFESHELEFEMYQSVFFPLHKRMYPSPTRDPSPTYSVLNFHIIANIFIDVFRAFENGTLEEGPMTQISAQDADADEVFFAAIDKWRIGKVMERGLYDTIRGIQEFVDVGLDVLFWLKARGLGGPARQRKERSDKGTRRAPKNSTKSKTTTINTSGVKKGRGRPSKVNTLVAKRQPKKAASGKVRASRLIRN